MGSICASNVLHALIIGEEVGAHVILRESMHRMGGVFVVRLANASPSRSVHAHHRPLQGEVLVGDTDAIGTHQPEFVEVRDVNHDIAFTPASQFTQHRCALCWLRRNRVSKALELSASLPRLPESPRTRVRISRSPRFRGCQSDGVIRGSLRWELNTVSIPGQS